MPMLIQRTGSTGQQAAEDKAEGGRSQPITTSSACPTTPVRVNGAHTVLSHSSNSSNDSAIRYDNSSSGKQKKKRSAASNSTKTPTWVYVVLVSFVVLTIITYPEQLHPAPGSEPTLRHVFFYGWLTALSTGLGAAPFLCLPDVPSYWVGVCNAIAAGMMIAASYSLFMEGCSYDDPADTSAIPAFVRTVMGALLGLAFLVATKSFLDKYEDLKLGGLQGTDARKALLIFCVMTLHSFSEGVGIGVSFGGVHGNDLGVFISASLMVHNVPEGLAIAVVLIPRGASIAAAALWAISTSLPQPLMAVPAYMFVHYFIPILPVGLGFAGGAMAWVAFVELLVEAVEDSGLRTTTICTLLALVGMLLIQSFLASETMSAAVSD